MEHMDYGAAKFWLDFGNLILTCVIGLYVWLSNRNRVTHERISALEKVFDQRVDAHTAQLAALQAGQDHGPTHDDLKRLHERIDETVAAINGLQGEFKGAAATLQLIHQHLLQKK